MTGILTPIFEPIFSQSSYGFRPNRRCEQAITKLIEYFNDGYVWIVNIDLEKFFDNVPQDNFPYSVLIWSNSTKLKLELCNCSQSPI